MKSWLLACSCAFELLQVTSSHAASYSIGGFTLGELVRRNRNFGSYQCESGVFPGTTECSRAQQRNAPSTGATADKVMYAEDGTAVYLMANVASAALGQDAISREIDSLSNTFKEQPKKIERLPARARLPNCVIVTWGDVELRQLRPEDLRESDPIWPGIFLHPLGDMERSVKEGLPIYRVTGGPGYVFSTSFDSTGRGYRRYEAVDIARPLVKKFEQDLRQVLAKDRALPRTDYGLWSDVAVLTRALALDTSPTIANAAQDRVFAGQPSAQKLRSHGWAFLPLGTVNFLYQFEHSSRVSPYRANTEYPGIRRDIEDFLARNPSEPFNEFLYYAVGEFDKALATKPNSVIAGVISYARGHELMQAMLEEVPPAVKEKIRESENDAIGIDVGPVNSALTTLNWYPELYDRKLLAQVIPDFAQRAAAMRPYFEAALRDKSAPHADDAAYMLGWLAYHQGQPLDAVNYLSQAMVVGNGDFKRPAAMRELVRILTQYPPSEQAKMIASNPVLTPQPAFWYAAARSAFRAFDYAATIEIGERGLRTLHVPIERLPATTDPQKIADAIKKIFPPGKNRDPNAEEFDYTNAVEIPYVVEASRQILRYQNYLKSASLAPSDLEKRAKDIIVEYSLLLDRPPQQQPQRAASRAPLHKDLRQALNLVDVTLAGVPRAQPYANLREWLYFRKVRILVTYSPTSVPAAVSAMEAEFPKGDLMDDALAEEIFAQGGEMKDLNAAEATFHKLITDFPNSNALDNGYTWMAIIYRCMGRPEQAQKINTEILRLFPRSRHAALARERMANPEAKACGLPGFERS